MKTEQMLRRRNRLVMAGFIAVVAASAAAFADTTDSWLNPVTGNWTDPTQWSAGVVPNNGVPAGASYDAVIDAVGANYTVTLPGLQTTTISSLTVNSLNARVLLPDDSRNILVTPLIDVEAGSIHLGGTVSGALIQGAGTVETGGNDESTVFSNVTIAATVTVANAVGVSGTFTLDGGTIDLGVNSNFALSALQWSGSAAATVSGTGQIVCNGAVYSSSNGLYVGVGGPSLTLGSGITFTTGTGDGALWATDVNNGQPSKTGTVTNDGTIDVTPGRTVEFKSALVNAGTINLNQGTIIFDGATSSSGIGDLSRTGGTIWVAGSLTVPGGTLDLDGVFHGSVNISGTIDASVISTSSGATLTYEPPPGGLTYSPGFTSPSGVTIGADVVIDPAGNNLKIGFANGINFDQHNLYVGMETTLALAAGNLTGTGQIVVEGGGSGGPPTILSSPAGQILTIGPGVTVRTKSQDQNANFFLQANGSFINQGTLSSESPGGSFDVTGVNWINQGVFNVSGGTFNLEGSTATANLGTITHSGGTLQLDGIRLDNTNATFTLDSTRGTWTAYGATILGGTIASAGGAIVTSGFAPGGYQLTLDGVTLQGDFSSSTFNGTTIVDGLTLSAGVVKLVNTMTFIGPECIAGSGTIDLESSALINPINGTFTIGPQVTIQTDTSGGQIGDTATSVPIVNQGTIISTITEGALIVTGSTVTNQGTISALGGGNLTFNNLVNNAAVNSDSSTITFSGNWSNTATITATGGTVKFAGPFTNTGAISLTNSTLVLNYYDPAQVLGNFSHTGETIFAAAIANESGSFDLSNTLYGPADLGTGANFTNMTVIASSSTPSLVSGNTASLSSATLAANVTLQSNSLLSLASSTLSGNVAMLTGSTLNMPGCTFSGQITMNPGTIINGNGGTITFNQGSISMTSTTMLSPASLEATSLLGTGQIVFAAGSGNTLFAKSGGLTIAAGITIRTGASGGTLSGTIANSGIVSSQTAGQTIALSGVSFTNSGTLQAINGGAIAVSRSGNTPNPGLFSTGIVDIASGSTLSSSGISLTLNGGILEGYGTISGSVAAGSGAHVIAPSANLPATSTGTLTTTFLTTNANTTLAFNLVSPGTSGVSDLIKVTGSGSPFISPLTLNGGTIQIANSSTGPASLGYYKAIEVNGGINGDGIGSLIMPPDDDNITYSLDTSHDPGFIDIHKGFLGDANDDGVINSVDYFQIDQGFLDHYTGWSNGDFNHDGVVNGQDYFIIDSNFIDDPGESDAAESPAAEILAHEALFGPSYLSQFSAAQLAAAGVPEPGSLALLGLGAVGLLAGRKRKVKE